VACAIEEHYLPVYSGGNLPKTDIGAVLSIADKIDTICGCFCVGLIPTGASDPYALRRQCIGIIQIILNKKMHFSLKKLIRESVFKYIEKDLEKADTVISDIFSFIQNRVIHILSEEGFSKDVIIAVFSVASEDLPDMVRRVKVVEEFKSQDDFEPLVIGFKRSVNILKKVDVSLIKDVDINLFEHYSESLLFDALLAVKESVLKNIEVKNYKQALIKIASLRDVIDDFFDNVLVMAEDELVRENRFALLKIVSLLFEKIADFSKILTK
jgi:glycyl-tRNA synthetase beta chain